jgi:outer membrane immunogenic protein
MRVLKVLPILAVLAAGTAAPAVAADIVEAGSPVAATSTGASPVYIWSGPYAGAFVGYNSTRFDQTGGADFEGDGFVGGVYGGVNFQDGSFVYGVEADIGGGGFDASGDNAATGLPIDGDNNVFGSLRGRVGVAMDPFLVFATGGLAVSEQELTLGGASDRETALGATVGAGVEGQITDSITSRIEYRYSNFGDQTFDLGNTSVSSGFDEHSVRAGVALKF